MPTVIDALVVTLGLDARQFVEGERDALSSFKKTKEGAESFGKDVEAQGKKLSDMFGIVKKGAVGIIGAIAGAEVAGFLNNLMGMDAATGRFAKTVGLSIPNLSIWEMMIKQIGGTAEEARAGLGGLQAQIQNFQAGISPLTPVMTTLLNRIGGWQGKDPDQIVRELVGYFDKEISSKRMTVPFAANMLRQGGFNESMVNLILSGADAFRKLEAAAIAAGPATKESADAAADYVAKAALLVDKLHDLARPVLPDVTKAVGEISTAMHEGGEALKAWQSGWKEAGEWFDNFGTKFDKFLASHVVKGGAFEKLWNFLLNKTPEQVIAEADAKLKAAEDERKRKAAAAGVAPGAAPAPLTVKPGAGVASPEAKKIMDAVSTVPGVKQVTALDDAYHRLLGGGPHSQGRAVDLTISDPSQSAAVVAAIKAKLAEAGINATVLNEYDRAKRSPGSTAPHIHIQLAPPKVGSYGGAGLPTGAPAAAAVNPSVTNNRREGDKAGNTTTVSMHIEKLNVNAPNATDADGIAREMAPALRRMQMAMTANSGLV